MVVAVVCIFSGAQRSAPHRPVCRQLNERRPAQHGHGDPGKLCISFEHCAGVRIPEVSYSLFSMRMDGGCLSAFGGHVCGCVCVCAGSGASSSVVMAVVCVCEQVLQSSGVQSEANNTGSTECGSAYNHAYVHMRVCVGGCCISLANIYLLSVSKKDRYLGIVGRLFSRLQCDVRCDT